MEFTDMFAGITVGVFGGASLVRAGLRALLAQEEDFRLPQEPALSRAPPAVLILCDDTQAALRSLRRNCPCSPVLVLTQSEDPCRLLELGAAGVMPFDAHPDDLIRAVRQAAHGEPVLHPTLMRALVARLAGEQPTCAPPALDSLTTRERQVLCWLVAGAGDKDIAQQLLISVRTVQSHLAHLYQKLGVHSRTEAAVMALRAGWLSDEEIRNSTQSKTSHPALEVG